jgi:hypothetical protein
MGELDGRVPWAIAPGNHDYGERGRADERKTLFNDYFDADALLGTPHYGATWEPGRLENSWHTFEGHGTEFLVLALEWGPRDAVVEWADKVLQAHPRHRTIIITHAYLYDDGERYDWAIYGDEQKWNPHSYGTGRSPEGTNDGQELWTKLVQRHPNIILTINGHVLGDGVALLTSTGDAGNAVHQMLVNYQMREEGGQGFMRLLEFTPDGTTVHVRTYSPSLDRWKTDEDDQFALEIVPPLG